jgi:hypothetical protein
MRHFIANILRTCEVTSMIWIHDGIWVCPGPGQSAVHVASDAANRALTEVIRQTTGLIPNQLVTIGIVDLNDQRNRTVSFLEGGTGPTRPQVNMSTHHPIQEVVHEFDYESIELLPATNNHACIPAQQTRPKRKLDLVDHPNVISKYFQRQKNTPG